MNTKDLTPSIICEHIRSNPGCVQENTYPNPGEPQLDEAAFSIEKYWEYLCFKCDTYTKVGCQACDSDDGTWLYQIDDAFPYPDDSEECYIGSSLSCWVEDGNIILESD